MNKYVDIGSRMKGFILSKFPSLADFCRSESISPQSLDMYLSGNRRPGDKMINRLTKYGCDRQWLLFGSSPEVEMPEQFGTVLYPVVSHIHAGSGDTKTTYTYESVEQLEGPSHPKYKGCLYFRVKGDSMEHKWEDGDHVLVDPKMKPKHGGYGVVCWNESEGALKKVFYQGNLVVLQSLNSNYPALTVRKDEIWFCGAVVTTLHNI